jgi:hypothetical protein
MTAGAVRGSEEDLTGRLDQIMERLDRIETRLPSRPTGLEESVELAGDVADQAASDLAVGLALGAASFGVGAGGWVIAQPGQDDQVQGLVELARADKSNAGHHQGQPFQEPRPLPPITARIITEPPASLTVISPRTTRPDGERAGWTIHPT